MAGTKLQTSIFFPFINFGCHIKYCIKGLILILQLGSVVELVLDITFDVNIFKFIDVISDQN